MASGGVLLDVHQFIQKMKEEQNGNLSKYKCFSELTSKQLEIDLSKPYIPNSETKEQRFIHGVIFEYAVHQAAKHTSKKNDPWKTFEKLYSTLEETEKEQYKTCINEAGRAAWKIFDNNANSVYGMNERSSTLFEYPIQNKTFPILTKTLEADIFEPSSPKIVCEIKYSAMNKDSYEQEYLVHAIVQVLIYSLALQLDPSTLHLQILVVFSKTREVVLYESDIHTNKTLVNLLVNKLNGKKEEFIVDDMFQSLKINE